MGCVCELEKKKLDFQSKIVEPWEEKRAEEQGKVVLILLI